MPVAANRRRSPRKILIALGAALAMSLVPTVASAQVDPRPTLAPGYFPWSEAASNIELLRNTPRAAPFDAPPGNFGFVNSDLAFTGDRAIVGSFNGFQVYDLSDPKAPVLAGSFVCPGGQGDVSVYGDLLFMSVEETRGRIDCGTTGAPGAVNPERFRGVRIFDISDLANPVQLPGVQTCRGSHTHTLVTDPGDPANVYVYNSGTAGVRSPLELPGCENAALTTSPVTTGNPTQWRIDVIKVPLAAPGTASVVSRPRIFTDAATGAFNGLQNTLPGTVQHPSGTGFYSPTPNTNTCHDITAFPALGLAAGACQGNGVLLDISDPANPVRIDAVSDPNFSYWHSATFSNDGKKVIFTDEWGGGTQPRCRVTDQPQWGADAIFDLVDGKLQFRSYYKLPVTQGDNQNCVAHNGSIVPVPGRDILVQAWYQGGLSVIDFTDSANPREIAYYDRGPINTPSATGLNLGGFWSTYWYNGHAYGTEIARGFDAFGLTPSDQLSLNEITAASEVEQAGFNAQLQSTLVNPPSFAVAGSYYDQAVRSGALAGPDADKVARHLDKAQKLRDLGETASAVDQLNAALNPLGPQHAALRQAILDLIGTLG